MNRAFRDIVGRFFGAALAVVLLVACEGAEDALAEAARYTDGFIAGRSQQESPTPARYFPPEGTKWSAGAKMNYALGYSDGESIRGEGATFAEIKRAFARGYADGVQTGHTRRETSMMPLPPDGADWPDAAKTSYGRGYRAGDGARLMREAERQGHRFQSRPASMSWPGNLRDRPPL